jgi:DNA invertase Pin-like site-specific DNA recombinase
MAPKKGIKVSDYRDLAEQGYSKSETARMLGVRVQTVDKVATKNRITFPMGYIKKEKRDALALQQET